MNLNSLEILMTGFLTFWPISYFYTFYFPDINRAIELLEALQKSKCSNLIVRLHELVFPPAPKKGMVKFPGKGHFKRATTGLKGHL